MKITKETTLAELQSILQEKGLSMKADLERSTYYVRLIRSGWKTAYGSSEDLAQAIREALSSM